jgi:Ca-activated chloride channel family protein
MHRALRLALLLALSLACFLARNSAARAEGALVARAPNGEDRGLFPLTRTEVKGDIQGQVISVEVTQRFENKFAEKIEAVYVFPLPNDGAVDDMEMHIGDRVVRAEIRTREAARAAYDSARQQGQRAALLEQERPNIFTFSVANIDPGKAIEVKVHYFQVAHYDHGTYEMAFPMVVGPRYIPGQPLLAAPSGTGTHVDTNQVPDASRISPSYVPPGVRSGHSIALALRLDAGSELESVTSPTHAIGLNRPSKDSAQVTLSDKEEIPNKDFVLRWTLLAPEMRPSFFAYRPDPKQDGYFALSMEPRHDAPVTEIAPREIFFLLDTSGSMQGPPIQTAIAAVRKALVTLNPSDSFQIIDFADAASSFAPLPLPNTPDNLKKAHVYLDRLVASGGTNQLVGIHAALTAPGDSQRLRYVVFMTDGYIGNEVQVIAKTRAELGNARVFGFGIGGSVNRYLLDELSIAGRGAAEYIRPGEAPDSILGRFYERIGKPYLTDIEIDWGGAGVSEIQPSPLPDLSAFQPLVLYGRYKGAGPATIEIKGRIGMRPFSRKLNVNLPATEARGSAVSRLWAREKIASLTRSMHGDGARAATVDGITRLGLDHHLVTAYTSLVAIDVQSGGASQGNPRQVLQPGEAPAGVNLGSAGGVLANAQLSAPMPPPPPAEYRSSARRETGDDAAEDVMAAGSPGRHGCAGCATAGDGGQGAGLFVAALGLALAAGRRRARRLSAP